MSLTKTWYSKEEAIAKYGISELQLARWLELGTVRSETSDGKLLVNCNDIEQELGLVPSV